MQGVACCEELRKIASFAMTGQMSEEPAPELAFAEMLLGLLQPAAARLEYITAEMQPFSNQQRPDVVLIPTSGGYSGRTIFLEIKISTKPLQSGANFNNLVEQKTIAAEALGSPIARYVYVTDEAVSEFSKRFLKGHGIDVFDRVKMPQDVIDQLRQIGALA